MTIRRAFGVSVPAALSWLALFALGAELCLSGFAAVAQTGEGLPTLYTNQRLTENVQKRSTLDVNDLKAVLTYVLGELPARVRVYPTENYYYFYFYQDGIRYAGNFRFDVARRDEGLVEFVYFKESTEWSEDETDHHATLGKNDGVLVRRVGPLAYEVASRAAA